MQQDGGRRSVHDLTTGAGIFPAAAQGPYARLLFQSGELTGQAAVVSSKVFRIGAVGGNDLILPGDPTVSGSHAVLEWEQGILKVEDSRSTNGTFVNGERMSGLRVSLRPGDELRMGQTRMIVQAAERG